MPISGVGLGLRRAYIDDIGDPHVGVIDFLEVAPENWMRVGGRLGRRFRSLTERFPVICHGLSLSLGGPAPLDVDFLLELKAFLDRHRIRLYSEHLSFCSDDGHLYDLMPIPFTEEAIRHTAARIRRSQDILERRIAIENISYYLAPGAEMAEIEFLRSVLEEADCDLLLDLNNIYVNSVNHGYDALQFLQAVPAERIVCGHVAGHYAVAPELLVDTHGAPIIDPVWALLEAAYDRYGIFPTLLERDFNLPPLADLLDEVGRIRDLQSQHVKLARSHG